MAKDFPDWSCPEKISKTFGIPAAGLESPETRLGLTEFHAGNAILRCHPAFLDFMADDYGRLCFPTGVNHVRFENNPLGYFVNFRAQKVRKFTVYIPHKTCKGMRLAGNSQPGGAGAF